MEETITNGYSSTKNPQLQENSTFNYVGNVNDFDFSKHVKGQLRNYNVLTEILQRHGISFTELNLVKWNAPEKRRQPTNRYSFILKTTHPNLFWYKRDFDSFGIFLNLKNTEKCLVF